MILEGIVTTKNLDGSINIAPMGPIVDDDLGRLILRPFPSSTTCGNLLRERRGVFQITDDAALIARAAIGRLTPTPSLESSAPNYPPRLADACRWFAFDVQEVDESRRRVQFNCPVTARGVVRDFLGFNRAKHAVVEAAILATRVTLIPAAELAREFQRLSIIVDKTAGPGERRVFRELETYVQQESDARSRDCIVRAPSRLHFGLLSWGGQGRQFGGAGVMVDAPSLVVRGMPSQQFQATGPEAERVAEFAAVWQRTSGEREPPPIHIAVESLGAPHSGLGTGTQLALAVATILERMRQREIKSVECLAELMGRGRRSAVGTYGFGHGGLIVERGKLAAERISPLDQRLPLPAPWRFVLVRPQLDSGLHGAAEHQAFEKLPAVPPATAEQLNRLLDEQLLPAVRAHDFTRFSQSLYEYGYASGCCFAPAQGGAYRGPRLTQLVELIRSLGVVGVGQSSWGPTLFAAVPDDVAAHRLVQDLRLLDDDLLLTIAAPQNAGALVNGRPLLSTPSG